MTEGKKSSKVIGYVLGGLAIVVLLGIGGVYLVNNTFKTDEDEKADETVSEIETSLEGVSEDDFADSILSDEALGVEPEEESTAEEEGGEGEETTEDTSETTEENDPTGEINDLLDGLDSIDDSDLNI